MYMMVSLMYMVHAGRSLASQLGNWLEHLHVAFSCQEGLQSHYRWNFCMATDSFKSTLSGKVKSCIDFFDLALEVLCVTLLYSVGYQKIISQHKFKRRVSCSKVCGRGATVSAFLKKKQSFTTCYQPMPMGMKSPSSDLKSHSWNLSKFIDMR